MKAAEPAEPLTARPMPYMKLLTQELGAAHELLEKIVATSPEGIIIVDQETKILLFHAGAEAKLRLRQP